MIKIIPISPHNYALDFFATPEKKMIWKGSNYEKMIQDKLDEIKQISWSSAWGKSRLTRKNNDEVKFTEIEIRIALKFKTTNKKKQQEIIVEITEFLQTKFTTK